MLGVQEGRNEGEADGTLPCWIPPGAVWGWGACWWTLERGLGHLSAAE